MIEKMTFNMDDPELGRWMVDKIRTFTVRLAHAVVVHEPKCIRTSPEGIAILSMATLSDQVKYGMGERIESECECYAYFHGIKMYEDVSMRSGDSDVDYVFVYPETCEVER